MSTKLNLSSNPFRNRALPWTVTTIIAVFSVIALMLIVKWTSDTNAQTQKAAHDVVELRSQTEAIAHRTDEIKTALSPEQQRALSSAHTLVNRKQFSWSRLFADLERALPDNVRVQRIAVKDVRAQEANLELVVASKNPSIITQMIQDMHSQGIFDAVLVSQNQLRSKAEGGEEYEMSVHYVPRAGSAIDIGEKNRRPVDTASEGGKQR